LEITKKKKEEVRKSAKSENQGKTWTTIQVLPGFGKWTVFNQYGSITLVSQRSQRRGNSFHKPGGGTIQEIFLLFTTL
jgi:hypothetical protein